MSWSLEALTLIALEEAGGAVQRKVSLLARGHARRPGLARATSESLTWRSALHLPQPLKDPFT